MLKKYFLLIFMFFIILSQSFSSEIFDKYVSIIEKQYCNRWITDTDENGYDNYSLWTISELIENHNTEKCIILTQISSEGIIFFSIISEYHFSYNQTYHFEIRAKDKYIGCNYFKLYEEHAVKNLPNIISSAFIVDTDREPDYLTIPIASKEILKSYLNFDSFEITIRNQSYNDDIEIKTNQIKLPINIYNIDYALYYAVIAQDLSLVKNILQKYPNILREDKKKFVLLIEVFMQYYEKNTTDIIKLSTCRKINELLVEYGIEDASINQPIDPNTRIYNFE